MSRICDIYDVIDGAAPFSSALDFDNCGLLVGDMNANVDRVLVALDITEAVVEEAKQISADLIISHHPVIFSPLRTLGPRDVPYQLIRSGIAALCCHTNLDASPVCGVNAALAGKLGLRSVHREDVFDGDCILFAGELAAETAPADFAALVRERLGLHSVRFIPGARPVKKVFLCSGAGGEFARFAAWRGADAYLTGEMKHHEALEAARTGLTCVAAGHYETEKLFGEFLVSYLKKRLPETPFIISQAEQPPFTTL